MGTLYRNYSPFLLLLFLSLSVHCAGLRMYTEMETRVIVVLDNGVKRELDMKPSSKPVIIDAFFTGFMTIKWLYINGKYYEVPLDIKWNKGWYTLVISGKKLYIQKDGDPDHSVINAQISA